MKLKIARNQRKHAGGRYWLFDKAGAREAPLLTEGEVCLQAVPNRGNSTITPMRRLFVLGMLGVLLAVTVSAQTSQNIPDVTAISLEDLMNMQVTSVSKRAQKLADAAAAIFVITQDDIRRSGASSIPEALRLVPGLEVARIDENKWAIGSRGFNGRFDINCWFSSTAAAFIRRCFPACIGTCKTCCWKMWIALK